MLPGRGEGADVAAPAWARPADEVLRELESSDRGLEGGEAARRLEEYGPNELAEETGPSPFGVLARQFRSPLIYILFVAALVTVVLREFVDAGVIGAVLVVNAVLGFTQEYRAEQAMEALRRVSRARARVLRDRREREVDAAELVPGDVVLVEAGDRVPADCRLLRSSSLETDESLLTGESTTVAKSAEPVDEDAPLGDRASMIFTATVATRGHGRAVVVATGERTELGRIAGSMREIGEVETPLQRRMARFARIVGAAVLAFSALGVGIGLATGEELDDLLLAAVGLAVAAIPEGLPIVLTVVLAISVRRMAVRNAIVRRLPAVETLGGCSVIGSDKTGTLTENRMTVQTIVAGGETHTVTGAGYETGGEVDGPVEEGSPLHLTLLAGVLCNEASAVASGDEFEVRGDPTEIALLVSAAKAGLSKDELEDEYTRFADVPFESERRFAATFNRRDGTAFVFVKGAPEAVLEMTDGADQEAVLAAADRLADHGLRVLALAYRELEDPGRIETEEAHVHLDRLTFLGLQGMIDPPRAEAVQAVADCQGAGIRVLMITGDHARTGAAIAEQLGIEGAGRGAVTGAEIERMDAEEFSRAVREYAVFARVSPEHKLLIVDALREQGETVAVTGDGINDAPALKAADIGAAMGRSGTDVAKEAADIVVADDNFASIFAAVEQGRIAFDNVRKTTFFLVSTAAGLVLAVLASIVFRLQLPFLPAQLLWLNLVTNGVQDVALAFEPGEKDVLRRPPRARDEGVVSPLLWERSAVVAVVSAAGTLALFLAELDAHDDLGRARTVAVTTMVLFQVFHVGNSRSEHLSAFAKSPFSNRFLFVGTAAALAIHTGALYLPFTQFILRVEPLDAATWVRMAAVASSVILAVELHKLVRGPHGAKGAFGRAT